LLTCKGLNRTIAGFDGEEAWLHISQAKSAGKKDGLAQGHPIYVVATKE
jgi:hypothetical protein